MEPTGQYIRVYQPNPHVGTNCSHPNYCHDLSPDPDHCPSRCLNRCLGRCYDRSPDSDHCPGDAPVHCLGFVEDGPEAEVMSRLEPPQGAQLAWVQERWQAGQVQQSVVEPEVQPQVVGLERHSVGASAVAQLATGPKMGMELLLVGG
ncbi:hypothetical protein ACQ4M4_22755 [Leptolyngbya sp. AN02str]|uniref:hypothetical protein n=1 Tax=Leptolyngbya sp. AN02str TaxID=3423363 RepID=UPI003D32178E